MSNVRPKKPSPTQGVVVAITARIRLISVACEDSELRAKVRKAAEEFGTVFDSDAKSAYNFIVRVRATYMNLSHVASYLRSLGEDKNEDPEPAWNGETPYTTREDIPLD